MKPEIININRGLDITLRGDCVTDKLNPVKIALYGIAPEDFPGYTWKPDVRLGDTVAAGAPLLHAKEEPSLCLTSPVSGTVKEIRRGERRKILYVVVEAHDTARPAAEPRDFSELLKTASPVEVLAQSGLLAQFRQRPFDVVPSPAVTPRDIFITGFDSAPLAADILRKEDLDDLEAGLKVLSPLTKGKVYLSLRPDAPFTPKGAEVLRVSGPHPAGNVGVQIAAVAPVNKGETVWCADATVVCRIGRLWKTGHDDWTANVAVTGPRIIAPEIRSTFAGAEMKTLIGAQILPCWEPELRIISGNVLTGVRVNFKDGFLRWPYRQITIIDEGDKKEEFMGWASLNPKRYSVKRTFPAWLRGLSKPFNFDARIKGGHRAMILSGEYDKVFPFDIYPEYLIKAIIAGDIDRMEQLGIYEVAPEDFALPEFVDTSKQELQKLVRQGLDLVRKEG